MPLLRFVMIFVYTHDLSADRWLDVSFVLDGFLGVAWGHDGLGFGWDIYTGLESACGLSVEHACVLTTNDDGFSMTQTIHNRFAAR